MGIFKSCVIFILSLSLSSVRSNKENFDAAIWTKFMIQARLETYKLTSIFKNFISDKFLYNHSISKQCFKSLLLYKSGLEEWEPWAVKMFDATGKLPSGILDGTKIDFGSFDQCLEIRQIESSPSFKGQFCMLDIKTPLISPLNWKTSINKTYTETYGVPPEWIYDMMKEQSGLLSTFGLYLGVCLPSTCSQKEFISILTNFTKSTPLNIVISDCQVEEPSQWSTSTLISISILSCLLSVCVFATCLDLYDRQKGEERMIKKQEYRENLKAFSLYTNTMNLFETPRIQNSIDSLHGIRVVLCLWIMYCHTYFYPSRWKENKFSSYNNALKLLYGPAIIVDNGIINIENFFVISGFLFSYTLWKKLEQNGKINICQFIIQKYWRLMPVHIFILVLQFALPVIYNGPIWNSTWEEETGRCQKFGWRNLLFVQNLSSMKDLCWLHTWYLAALMQIQIVSLFLLILVYRNHKKGILVGVLLLIGCFTYDFVTSVQNGFILPSLKAMKSFDTVRDYISKIYIKPFNHFSSHLVGMVLGWYVLKFKNHRLPMIFQYIGWILYFVFTLLILFAIWFPANNTTIISIHNATRNLIWASCFSWLLYNCTTNSEGFLHRVLSWKAFVPLSQISYLVYLLHPLFIIFNEASLRNRTYMGNIAFLRDFLALVLATFTFAFLAYIAVEAPFNTLYNSWNTTKHASVSMNGTTCDKKMEINGVELKKWKNS